MTWRALAAIGVGGGLGSILRYLVGFAAVQRLGPGFPFGTLIVNLAGSFAIGAIAELAQSRALGITPLIRLFLTVGVLGGFTTFSSFSFETVTLAAEGAPLIAIAYAAGSVVAGFAAALGGMLLVRAISQI